LQNKPYPAHSKQTYLFVLNWWEKYHYQGVILKEKTDEAKWMERQRQGKKEFLLAYGPNTMSGIWIL